MATRSRHHRKAPSSPEVQGPFFDKAGASRAFFQPGEPAIQAKLTVSQPGDVFEQEADRVADTMVNHQSSPQVQQKPEGMIHSQTPEKEEEKPVARQAEKKEEEKPIARQADKEEEEKQIARQAEKKEEEKPIARQAAEKEEEEPPIQAKANDSHSTRAGLSQQLSHSRGQGNPLPTATHAEMSTALGYDFSDVTIHTDAQAVRLNRELNAQAFTQGKDIYFNEGKFDPTSRSGQHLLAHELAHVMQQTGGQIQRQITQKPPSPIQTIPKWTDLPSQVLADLKSLEAKLKHNPKLFNFMKAYQTDPLRRLTVLNLYVKLQDLNLWQFVNRIERSTGVGDLEFLANNIVNLMNELKQRKGFTFKGSAKGWECRENRGEASIHFKHFEGWEDNKVQAHIDQAGWVFGSYSKHLLDYFVEKKFEELPELPVGRKNVFKIRGLLLEQRKREKKT